MEKNNREKMFFTSFIIIFLIASLFLSSQINFSIPNTEQRKTAGFLLSELVSDIGEIHSFGDIIERFASYYNHYAAFTAFTEWPQLQIILMTALFLILGESAPIVLGLIFSVCALFLLWKILQKEFKDPYIRYFALAIIAYNAYFLYFSTEPFFEMGTLVFKLACFYFLAKYLEKDNELYLYLAAMLFGLSVFYKMEHLMEAVPLALYFLYKKGVNGIKAHIKKPKRIIISAAIVIFFISLVVLPQIILQNYGFDILKDRTIGRVDKETSGKDLAFVSAEEFEFSRNLGYDGQQTITMRVDMGVKNRFFLVVSYFSYLWFLLPLLFFRLYQIAQGSKVSDFEFFGLVSIATYVVLFTLVHFIPRYMMPILPFFILISLKPLFSIKKILRYALLSIIVVVALLHTYGFMDRLNEGESMSSPQHDFYGAANIVESYLRQNSFEGTVITTNPQSMGYYFSIIDKEKRVYLQYMPQNSSQFVELLKSKCNVLPKNMPDGIKLKKPDCKAIIIHEGFENYTDYYTGKTFDSLEYVKSLDSFRLNSVIGEKNSKTYIFFKA